MNQHSWNIKHDKYLKRKGNIQVKWPHELIREREIPSKIRAKSKIPMGGRASNYNKLTSQNIWWLLKHQVTNYISSDTMTQLK